MAHQPHHDCIMITPCVLTEGAVEKRPTHRTRLVSAPRAPTARLERIRGRVPVMAHLPDHDCIMITSCVLTEGAAERRPAPLSRATRADRPLRTRFERIRG